MTELYVKSWFFSVVLIITIVCGSLAVYYSGENSNKQTLLNTIGNEYQQQLTSATTNYTNSITQLSNQITTLQTDIIQKNIQIINLSLQQDLLNNTITNLKSINENLSFNYSIYNSTLNENQNLTLLLNNTIISLNENITIKNNYWHQLNETLLLYNNLLNLKDKYHLYDPTKQDAVNFIELDATDENNYDESFSYVCEVNINGADGGIRCGVMGFYTSTKEFHFLNVFDTTDNGLVYFDTDDTQYDNLGEIEDVYGTIEYYEITW